MNNRNFTSKARQYELELTGIVSDWALVTLTVNNTAIAEHETEEQEPHTFLIGHLDIDFSGKLKRGSRFKSNQVTHFNKGQLLVTSMNSCYQLIGPGCKMVTDRKFIDLFMSSGFRPDQIIKIFPELVIGYTPFISIPKSINKVGASNAGKKQSGWYWVKLFVSNSSFR